MKFDGNQAWRQAVAWVSANRDVVIAIAGVFFLLPSLVTSLFGPQPPAPTVGMTARQMIAAAQLFYLRALPFLIPMLLLQGVGILALLMLFTDARRPTVGTALRQGVAGILSYVVAQLLPGFAIGALAATIFVVAGLLVALLGGAATTSLVVLALAVSIVAAIYVFVRCSLSGPVIAVERTRNPIRALMRSWTLTSGNTGRLVLLYLLLGILFIVVITTVTAVTGIVLALALSPANARTVSEIISSVLSAAATVYFVAILAAAHRQLAGPATADHRATFE